MDTISICDPATADKLSLSPEQFRQAYRSSDGTPYDNIVIGVFIIRDTRALLLLSPNDIHFPNAFELPRVTVDGTVHNTSLDDFLVGEIMRKTGLKIEKVVGELVPSLIGAGKVILNPAEHSEFDWAVEANLHAFEVHSRGFLGLDIMLHQKAR
ncbi:uncharacterized protein LY89DRAFT_675508 [Mollisia scopiformis]|uniref:Nudix hydrolase domain-containing protein n=1 Tax=Mollisia scopiformis TaxID=149040 RepID=A0A132BCB1_MOLSC|nr:uncharacterized protein LY89DRAFT_675508 [Mollisia scopiformis]KUJ10008.1 hypothetical protein LY89DRAFT_675508 [Mollisia scopiformis]